MSERPSVGSGTSSDAFSSSRPVHLIEDAELLLRGDFSRDGFDLVITGPDGQVLVVADYFSFNPPPNLMLPNGAGFSPELVRSLLHNVFDDAMYAGPAGSAAQVAIGKVAFIIGQVIRKGPNGDEVLQKGDILYKGDEIEVIGAGRLLARMNDGTTFRLGQDARAVLTDFEYDESAQKGNFEATVIRGGFNYKSGGISKFAAGGNHSKISTPTAVIGIRGSELDGTVSSTGETIVIHKSGILTVTDINGDNPVELTVPGNTSVIVLNGNPSFTPQASPEQQATVEQSIPPPGDEEQEVLDESGEQEETAAEGESTESGEETSGEASGDQNEGTEGEAAGEGESQGEGESEETTEEDGEDSEEDAESGDEESQDDADGTGEGSDSEGGDDGSGSEGSGDSQSGTTGSSPSGGTGLGTGTTTGGSTGSGKGAGSTSTKTATTGSKGSTSGSDSLVKTGLGETPSTEPTAPEPILPTDNKPIAVNDAISVTTSGPTPLFSTILSNDSDPDIAQTPTITSVDTSNSQGTVTFDAATETLEYTPNADQFKALGEGVTGTDQFTYQIKSGDLTDIGTVTVTLTGVNDAPIASDDNYSIDENTILTVPASTGILANDLDPDSGDTLSVTGATVLTSDQTPIAIQADGSFSFLTTSSPGIDALDTGETLTSQFTYVVTDSGGLTSTATVTITVTGVNDAPIAGADSVSVLESTTITINPLDNDSDPEGDAFTIVGATSTAGTVTVSADGTSLSYLATNTLREGQVGEETITYTLSDGGATSTGTITLTVTGQNDPPVLTPPAPEDRVKIDPTAGPVDIEADILASIFDDNGTPVSITAIDTTGTLGSVILGSVLYDAGSAFDFLNVGETATDTFNVTAEDDTGQQANGDYTVVIEGRADAPVTNSAITFNALDNEANQTVSLLTGITDVDATDVLNVDAGSLVITGDATGISIVGNSVLVTPTLYTFTPGVTSKTVTLTYNVTDTTGLSTAQTATITVTQSNLPPVVSAPLTLTATEDAAVQNLDLLSGATDPNGDPLTITGLTVTGNVGGISQTGTTLTIDPQFYNGLAGGTNEAIVYSYTIEDGKGGTVAQTASINITGVNDAPTPVADTNTIDEDGSLLVTAATGVLVNDIDPDTGATRTVTAVQGAAANVGNVVTLASGSSIILNADGSYDYFPAPELSVGQTSQDVISFTITDDQGATAVDTLTITVTGNNDLPTIPPGFFTTGESVLLSSGDDLLINAFDPDPLDVLGFTSATNQGVTVLPGVTTTLTSGASITIDAAGLLSNYDPRDSRLLRGLDNGEQFTESFTLTINDGQGGTATSTFSIEVNGESSQALLLKSHSGPTQIEPTLDIVGDTLLNLQGGFVSVESTGNARSQIIAIADTGGKTTTSTTDVFNEVVAANDIFLDRDWFAFSENRFVVDDRIATLTIEGLLNEVSDHADAFSIDLNSFETLIIDLDGGSNAGISSGLLEVSIFSGSTLIATNTDGGLFDTGTFDSAEPFLLFQPTTSGTYTIVVTGNGAIQGATNYITSTSLQTADYTLNLSLKTSQPEEFTGNTVTILDETEIEPTVTLRDLPNTPGTAFELLRQDFTTTPNQLLRDDSTSSSLTIVGDFSARDQKDYVKVQLTAGETITIDFDFTEGGPPSGSGTDDLNVASIILLDPTGTNQSPTNSPLVDSGTQGTNDNLYFYTATTTGTHTIGLIASGAPETGDYVVHFSIDTLGATDTTATVLDERSFDGPSYRPDIDAISTSINTDFGINSFINQNGDVFLFGETSPANFESILQTFSFEGLLSDSNNRSTVTFFATDNSGEPFKITSRDILEQSTELQLADISGTPGAPGAPGTPNGTVVAIDSDSTLPGNLVGSGDFNGDGFDDLLYLDQYAYAGTAGAYGIGTIVYGSATPPPNLASANYTTFTMAPIGPGGSRMFSNLYNAGFAGDVNGDGFDDIVVSFYEYIGGISNSSVVIFGGNGPTSNIQIDSSTTTLNEMLVVESDKLKSIGDINGDGYDDLIATKFSGSDAIVFGQSIADFSSYTIGTHLDVSSPNGAILQLDGDATFRPYSQLDTEISLQSIQDVIGIGDVNGDGFDDLAFTFGSSGFSQNFTAIVFGDERSALTSRAEASNIYDQLSFRELTGSSQVLIADRTTGADGLTLSPPIEGFDNIRGIGDINGDGIDDIAVTIINRQTAKYRSDTAAGTYVIFGGTGLDDFAQDFSASGATIADLVNGDGSLGFRITSSELERDVFTRDNILTKVTNVGDVNGDGFDDLLVSANLVNNYAGGGTNTEVTLVDFSSDSALVFGGPGIADNSNRLDTATLRADQGFEIKSSSPSNANERVNPFKSIGDFNGDGFDDFGIFDETFDSNLGPQIGYGYQQTQSNLTVVFGGQFSDPTTTIAGTDSGDVIGQFPGSQVIRAGAGDDTISFDPADFLIDGGGGSNDLVIVESSGNNIDITQPNSLANIEIIDLGGLGNSLVLDAVSVANLSNSNILTVTGSAGDSVLTLDDTWQFAGSFTDTQTAAVFDIFESGPATIQIDQDITSSIGIDVDPGITDQSFTGNVSGPESAIPISLPTGGTITAINGNTFTVGTPFDLDGGGPGTATVTVTDATSAVFNYDPGTDFQSLNGQEFGHQAIEFTATTGAGDKNITYRLNVTDISDPINFVPGAPQNYTGGLSIPIFGPGLEFSDVDSPTVGMIQIVLDTTSTVTTFGSFILDDVDPLFGFDASSTDTIQLLSYNDKDIPIEKVEEFLQAIRYVPDASDTGTPTFLITINQGDTSTTSSTLTHTLQVSVPPRPVHTNSGTWNPTTTTTWSPGAIPTASDELLFDGPSLPPLTVNGPAFAGDILINSAGFSLNVLDTLTVSNSFRVIDVGSLTVSASSNNAAIIADTFVLDTRVLSTTGQITSGASIDLSSSGSFVAKLVASTSMILDGFVSLGIAPVPVRFETPQADLTSLELFAGMSADARFLNPSGTINITIGENTQLTGGLTGNTVFFENANINLVSDFTLREDQTGSVHTALELTGNSNIGGAGTFINQRPDFFLDDDTLLSGGSLRNEGILIIMNATLLSGSVANQGLMEFAGSTAIIDTDLVNRRTGAIAIRDDGTQTNNITITADNRLINDGELRIQSPGQAIAGSITNRGFLEVESGASLTIDNTGSLFNLAGGTVSFADPTGSITVNNGDVVINNSTRFENATNGTNVIFNSNVYNGAAALLVDTDSQGEGLLLRGNFTLGNNALSALVNQGTLGKPLNRVTLDFGGKVKILEDSVWNLDMDSSTTTRDNLVLDEVELNGEIRPRFANTSFVAGDTFILISALSLSGSFSFLDSRIAPGGENQLFSSPGVLNGDPGTGLVGNIVYDRTEGASSVTFEVKAVTLDSTANGSPIFAGTAGEDVFYGTGANNEYQNIGPNDIVVDQGAGFETFRVTALDFARIAGESSGTNRLSLEAGGEFNFIDLPGTALDNINELVLASGSQQIIVLDDQAILKIMDETAGNGPLTITSFATEGDKVQLFGDFNPGMVSTSTEYTSPLTSVSISDGVLVEIFRSDGITGFFGTSQGESLIGTGGDDRIDARAGDDSIDAQGGNDLIIFDSLDTGTINGGTEIDTLVVLGDSLDLTGVDNLVNFEKVDLQFGSLNVNFADLFGTGSFLEAGAIDVFSTDPSFGDHQLLINGDTANGLTIEGVDLTSSPFSDLLNEGVTIGASTEIDGAFYLPFTKGDVTIFLSEDLSLSGGLPPLN